jgi:L-amino acid N-acyltransferase YncA
MSTIAIRPAARADLPQITSIYNHYVVNTPITFDIEPLRPEQRVEWFDEHTEGARYRLFVRQFLYVRSTNTPTPSLRKQDKGQMLTSC